MTPSTSAGFELVLRDPAPGLRGLVRGYGGFRERAPGPVRRRELPTTDVVVILDLGRGWRVSDCADPHGPGERHGSFVAGLDDRAVAVEHDGDAHCVQVDLTPLGARALLGASLPELARRVVALEDVIGAEASSLVERLHAARGWEARFALLDAAFAARGRGARYPRPDTAWAWRRLEQSHGVSRSARSRPSSAAAGVTSAPASGRSSAFRRSGSRA